MNRIFSFLWISSIILVFSCNQEPEKILPVSIIPKPVQLIQNPGGFHIDENTSVRFAGTELNQTALLLVSHLNHLAGFGLKAEKAQLPDKNSIFLRIDSSLISHLGEEGYHFHSDKDKIEITAADPAGIFYGVQTLYQLLPVTYLKHEAQKAGHWVIPAVEVTDYPRFSWRGMHLDVSRHFFPVEFIKKYIDLIAMHKMNIFHWHLTDDNGWRIEMDQHPLLTEVAAWRVDRESLPWDARPLPQPGEKATYGGFYSKEEIRDVIDYASERHITIIPEIEMPGHTSEVFAAYPELSCTGERIGVKPGSYWPITDIFCAGKEETFVFIENVLREVAELFPSGYIHIGGDEADKARWRACPLCQQRIKSEHLSGEEELQSYFIRRVEKMLAGMDKKLIGWDEILEGGLAPEATVMSWRGFEGGIEAARQGHDVVMCPTSYCYFDYYQADPGFQPEAIGGLITLRKVYSFNPVPSELNAAEAGHILGAQGNIWSEYIATPEKVEYMALPRMTALAEVLWSPAGSGNWEDFRSRLKDQFLRFDALNVNYSEGSAKVNLETHYDSMYRVMKIGMDTEMAGTEIFFTLDGSEPGENSCRYTTPIELKENTVVKAIARKNGRFLEKPAVNQIAVHKGIGCQVTYLESFSGRYTAQGETALNDGLSASSAFNDGMWQGFNGNDMDVVFDLKEGCTVNTVEATFLQDQERWIFLPEKLTLFISDDGDSFEKLTVINHHIPRQSEAPLIHSFSFYSDKPLEVRCIRIQAKNMGQCPAWHPGTGQPAWIFADEIVIH